ncbi:hypothetical protein [Pseudomonas sp. 6D_7.1_Bac1]|uniref:DUF4760 domain-containing protein n=1 Tax=Pseudomonas sp. 6D_7.1_Bac1 TaxID=2971615 RepID=UPI0021C58EEA|nr:hypothetical protein [Pseudomonas sp. 6D_7.1_Bac1]MCU1752176.1 hypothetical protein [Pseudomonas sp. 6D_7.1_Bac1]
MEFIEKYRPYAEFAYFVSWPLILLGVAVAIYQLKAFKKEAKTRFQRETIAMSISILDRKLQSIEEYATNAFRESSYLDSPEFSGEIIGLSSAESTFNQEWLDWYESDDAIPFSHLVTLALNDMENFAHYIYSGITDEELCYKLEHNFILSNIEGFLPYIAHARDDEDHVVYESIARLYRDWSDKAAHDKTQKELKKIATKLKENKRPESFKSLV